MAATFVVTSWMGGTAEEFVLVEVEEFDLAIAVCVCATKEYVPFGFFRVVAGEGGVVVHLDVAVEHVRLAGRTTAFPAAVHEVDSLPECGVEDGLVLGDLHLDVDGFEADVMRVGHEVSWAL